MAIQPSGYVANVRDNSLSTVLFVQAVGVYGTIIAPAKSGTAGGYSGNWWQIKWDSGPPLYGSTGWSAEPVISLAPTAGDVPQPNFSGSYYKSANIYWLNGNAPASTSPPNPPGCQLGTALGNCTWYAFGRMLELGYDTTQLNTLIGNATDWANEANNAHIRVDSTPTAGSVAQAPANPSGYYKSGHVAVVESVNSDGSITVTESSFVQDASNPWDFLWHHRTISPGSSAWLPNFIHVSKGGIATLSPPTLIGPGTPSAPGSPVSTVTPTFQWQQVSGADGYGLYVSKFNGSTYDLVFNSETDVGVPLTEAAYQLPNGKLVDGAQYRWNMRSHNSAGYGTQYSSRSYFYVSLAYTVNPIAGPNGSINPNTPQPVSSGGSVTFTATPNSGYTVDQWLLDGGAVQTGGASYTLSPVTAPHNVTVTFKTAVATYTVSPSAGPNGSLSPNTPQTVSSGGSVTFTATPNSGYTVDQWLLDGGAVQTGGASYTLSPVTAPHNVTVTFMTIPPTPPPLPMMYITTFAGLAGNSASVDGTGSAARFFAPYDVAADAAGNVFVADTMNHTIRMISPVGVVSTLAGSAGNSGGADGSTSVARFNQPEGVAVDSAGNVYVADSGNNTIRKISTAGQVSTLAGLAGNWGSADGTGSTARFNSPSSLAVDSSGNVYVSDTMNQTIRKITTGGFVTTLAGSSGNSGSADGTGSSARFFYPHGLAVDSGGNIVVADFFNYTIRRITPSGQVTTLAGTAGSPGTADGDGVAARFSGPWGIALDTFGRIFVADDGAYTIRMVTASGNVSTVAGTANTAGSADGVGSAARFNGLRGIAVDRSGNLYVADTDNETIREGTPTGSLMVTIGPQGAVSAGGQWQVDGGAWHNSGDTVSGLSVGSHSVHFSTITGWNTPPDQVVTVSSGSSITTTATYTSQSGSLQVTITPPGAVTAGAQWQVDGGVWQSSGATVSDLTVGPHTLAFSTVSGWTFSGWSDGTTQNPRTITVVAGTTTYTANFTPPQGTIVVAANPPNGGTVSGGGTFPVGSQQQIAATPASGWTFSGWSDGNAQNPRTVTVVAGTTTYTASLSWGQTTSYVVDRYDDPNEVSAWSHWWGSPAWTLDYDSTVDAGGGTTSGSMKVTVSFDAVAYPLDNQFSFVRGLNGQTISLAAFANLAMDVKWDPSSPTNSDGNYGYLEYGVRFSDYSQNYFGHMNIPATNNWVHLVAPIDQTMQNIDKVTGITFRMWAGAGLSGPATFWVDNIILNVSAPQQSVIALSGNLVFGNVAVGGSASGTLTIANTGNAALTVSSISYPSGFSGAWSGTVPAGGSQPVKVVFAPTAATSYGGNVTVNSDASGGVNTLAVSGTGVVPLQPVIALSGNLAFGNVPVGGSASATLTIANTGNAALTVSSISYPAGFSGAWSGTVPAGGSQPVKVVFAPTAATSYGGNVTVNSDATEGVANIAASGTGIPARPPNDDFANRIALSGFVVSVTGQNTNATKEPGEPDHAGNSGGKSVWWTWTAPADGTTTIATTGSSFDTLLAVYTGSTVSALSLVASNDDELPGVLTSRLSFSAQAGTAYQIAVDGWGGASGSIVLNLQEAVPLPTISAFSVAPSAIAVGGVFTISYTVSDVGGPGLARVGLWRTSGDGSASDPGWQEMDDQAPTGSGPFSGFFLDTPVLPGGYWYGLKVFDGAGNETDRTSAVTGAIHATVLPAQARINNPRLVGRQFSVSVTTSLGANYTLEYKNAWADPAWMPAQTVPGTGDTITLTDSTATSPSRFYRVRVQ